MGGKAVDGIGSRWEPIDAFVGWSEFERFEKWMQENIASGAACEVDVVRPYQGLAFKEKWFLHVDSGKVWRLVWPDSPFTRLFDLVA